VAASGSPSVAAAAKPISSGRDDRTAELAKDSGHEWARSLSRHPRPVIRFRSNAKVYRPLKEYVEATEKYSGKVSLGADGELLNYVAGQPFPKIDPTSPIADWPGIFSILVGDDYKTGGGQSGKIYELRSKGLFGASSRILFRTFSFSEHTLHVES